MAVVNRRAGGERLAVPCGQDDCVLVIGYLVEETDYAFGDSDCSLQKEIEKLLIGELWGQRVEIQKEPGQLGALALPSFCLHALGDIIEDDNRTDGGSLRNNGGGDVLHGKAGAVLPPEQIAGRTAGRAIMDRGMDGALFNRIGRSVGPGMVRKGVMHLPEHLRFFPSAHPEGGLVHKGDPAGDGYLEDPLSGGEQNELDPAFRLFKFRGPLVHELLESISVLPQFILNEPAPGNIPVASPDAHEYSRRLKDGLGEMLNPDRAPIRLYDAAL